MAPLAEAATVWPSAQARLPRPKASPWCRSSRCAELASNALDGVNSEPKAGIPMISSAISAPAGATTGASRLNTTPAASEMRSGRYGPRRSDSLPVSGENPASKAADARNVPLITRALAPSWLSRSGASTSITPNARPATAVSHRPTATCRSLTAAKAAARPCGSEFCCGAAIVKFTTMSPAPNTAAAENAGPVPIWLATAPITGPNSAPPTAAPRAVPSSSPRRSSGAALASQAMPAAQVQAPPTPWTSRAESSTSAVPDQPNSKVDALIKTSPIATPRRAPRCATSRPPGNAPASVPNG
jgi:hypothetical protein